ncbi:hypothetical protein CCR75_009786 [Bremia lactucae]|nr:hypothetical protein CCR75_009786 [Bremia lactucae]
MTDKTEAGFFVSLPDGTALLYSSELSRFCSCCEVAKVSDLNNSGQKETTQCIGPVGSVNFLYCEVNNSETRARAFHPAFECVKIEKKGTKIMFSKRKHEKCSSSHTVYRICDTVLQESQIAIRESSLETAQLVEYLYHGKTIIITLRRGDWPQSVEKDSGRAWIMLRAEVLEQATKVSLEFCETIDKIFISVLGKENEADAVNDKNLDSDESIAYATQYSLHLDAGGRNAEVDSLYKNDGLQDTSNGKPAEEGAPTHYEDLDASCVRTDEKVDAKHMFYDQSRHNILLMLPNKKIVKTAADHSGACVDTGKTFDGMFLFESESPDAEKDKVLEIDRFIQLYDIISCAEFELESILESEAENIAVLGSQDDVFDPVDELIVDLTVENVEEAFDCGNFHFRDKKESCDDNSKSFKFNGISKIEWANYAVSILKNFGVIKYCEQKQALSSAEDNLSQALFIADDADLVLEVLVGSDPLSDEWFQDIAATESSQLFSRDKWNDTYKLIMDNAAPDEILESQLFGDDGNYDLTCSFKYPLTRHRYCQTNNKSSSSRYLLKSRPSQDQYACNENFTELGEKLLTPSQNQSVVPVSKPAAPSCLAEEKSTGILGSVSKPSESLVRSRPSVHAPAASSKRLTKSASLLSFQPKGDMLSMSSIPKPRGSLLKSKDRSSTTARQR